MTICPYCQRPVSNYGITKHTPVCHRNPAARTPTLAALDDGTGVIVSQNIYERRRGPGAIGISTLVGQIGLWPEVAAEFGLRFTKRNPGLQPGTRRRKENPLNAPLTDWERNACKLLAMVEALP